MIFDDDDDDDDEGLHVGFFSQSTYNVTSQAKPIFSEILDISEIAE